MPVCTPTEVFQHMQTQADIVTAETIRITALILEATDEIEQDLGRKIESTAVTAEIFQDGLNCEIHGKKLYLKGIYRDLYSITTITEAGDTLTAKTAYNDGNDYIFDSKKGMLLRQDRNWSYEDAAIIITGLTGLVDPITGLTIKALKLAVIEKTALKSGLWTTEIITSEGTIRQTRQNMSKESRRTLRKYKPKRLA